MSRVRKCLIILLVMLPVLLSLPEPVLNMDVMAAGEKTLSLSGAVTLATNKSREYKKTKSKIFLKQAEYEEAVKSIALKKHNMATFRWTPLLSFKFPEKADLADEYEFTFKPLQIQSEIASLEHTLTDIKYSVCEEVSNLYVDLYTCQETIAYRKEQLSSMEKELEKNKARLAIGEAKEEDIKKAEEAIVTVRAELALKEREFQSSKEELSSLTGLDVTTGYVFSNPYRETEIGREWLESIEKTTLERSQTFYDAKLNTALARTAMETNYSLMHTQYGSRMNTILPYVNLAKMGAEIDEAEFKLYYNRFLNDIDSPWQGSIRILFFIRIPKEWFKGSIDGIRYVEDDPYALYTAVLEYQQALEEQEKTEKDIKKQVDSGFENMITARNAYLSLEQQTAKAYEDVERARLQNKAGKLTYQEYKEISDAYEEMELEKLEALQTYTQVLYSYDRLTCGAITDILNESEIGMNTAGSGESFVTEDLSEGAYYYINTIVEDNAFEIGIYIPDDCEAGVSQFELWVDGVQIGERTEVGKLLRHLTLTVDNAEEVFLRLYAGDEFVTDTVIDPSEYRGELPIEVTKRQEAGAVRAGSYSYEVNKTTNTVKLKLTMTQAEIRYFRLQKDKKNILSADPVPVEEEMTYLSVLAENLSEVTIEFFDENEEKIAEGYFDGKDMSVYRIVH